MREELLVIVLWITVAINTYILATTLADSSDNQTCLEETR